MKYKFVGVDLNGSKIIKTFEAISLTEVLDEFQSFLKAVGFVFDGELDIIDQHYDVVQYKNEYDLGVTESLKND